MRATEFTPKKGKPKVYLDMDGVLADFFAEYAKLAGVTSGSYRDIPPAKTDPTLNKMVGTDFFARLPKFPTADTLVNLTVKTFGGYSICSSPLRGDHAGSEHYKKVWIGQHLRPGPDEIIITSRKEKYAVQPDGTPNILVDDRGTNITHWEHAGGIGIKYQADEDPLSVIVQGFNHALNVINGDVKHAPRTMISKDRSQVIQTPDTEPGSAADIKETIYQHMSEEIPSIDFTKAKQGNLNFGGRPQGGGRIAGQISPTPQAQKKREQRALPSDEELTQELEKDAPYLDSLLKSKPRAPDTRFDTFIDNLIGKIPNNFRKARVALLRLRRMGLQNTTTQTVIMSVLMAIINRLIVAYGVNNGYTPFAITVALETVLPAIAGWLYTHFQGGGTKLSLKNAILGGGLGGLAALGTFAFEDISDEDLLLEYHLDKIKII